MTKAKNQACVFINSSNSKKMINLGSQITIKIPFPPVVDPYDLVKTKDGKIPSRVPNAFLIYRKIYIETAKNEGYHLPMTVISSMASKSWEQENEIVKDEYKRLAKEAYDVRNEMLPKSQRKKKRAKWNIISFEKKTRKSPALKTQEPAKRIKESTSKVTQLASPVSSPEPQLINPSPIIPQFESFSSCESNMEIERFDFDFTQNIEHMIDMNINVPNPEILSIEEELIKSIDSILLPSPDLSSIGSPELNSKYEFNLESSSSNTIESPIFTEELFDFMTPVNDDYQINNTYETYETYDTYDGLGISNSIEFIPTIPTLTEPEEILFTHDTLDMLAYDDICNYY